MGRRGRGFGGGMGPGGPRGGGPRGGGPRAGTGQPRERLGPRAQQRLREAEALRDAGRSAEAAAAFREMADIARSQGMDRVARHLSLQADRCLGHAPPAAPSAPPASASAAPSLPSHCDTCGGPVSSSKVCWNADGSADCTYCGVVLG